MTQPKLTLTFMPPLVVILLNLERRKGSQLTEQEVVEIRDKGVCIALSVEEARLVAEKRGYDDIDAENVWAEWQRARAEIAAAETNG